MAYFSNSSDGSILDDQCCDCPLGYGWNDPGQRQLFGQEREVKPCPTALVQAMYNYDQLKPGNEQLRAAMATLVDDDGVCKTRKLLVEIRREQHA